MVLRTIGPRITGPWDLGCLGSKVRGPKVRGSKALGLIILEPLLADTNMDYLTSEWPGMPNFKVDANFDVFPQKYG